MADGENQHQNMDEPNDQSFEPPTAPDIVSRRGVMEKFGALDASIQGILGSLFTQSQAHQPLLTLLQMKTWGLPCPVKVLLLLYAVLRVVLVLLWALNPLLLQAEMTCQ